MHFFRHCILFWFILSSSLPAIAQTRSGVIKVYFFLSDACRICQEMTPYIKEIQKEYEHDFEFAAVFPNLSSGESEIQKFLKKYKLEIITQQDYQKKLAVKTGATITPEVVVWDETNNMLLYRGRINDLYHSPGKRKHHVTSHDLKEVLQNLKQGKEIPHREVQAVGCYINFADDGEDK